MNTTARTLLSIELLALVLVICLGLFMVTSAGGHLVDFAAFGFSLAPIALLGIAIVYTGNDILNPLWGLLVSLLFGTTLRTIYIIGDGNSPTVIGLMSGQDVASLFPGFFLMFLSVLSITIGYIIPVSRMRFRLERLLPNNIKWSPYLLTFIVLSTCIIGTIAAFKLVQMSGDAIDSLETLSTKRQDTEASMDGSPAAAAYLGWAGLLPTYALLVCSVILTNDSSKRRLIYVKALTCVAVLGVMVYPIIASERTPLIYAIIGPFIIYVARNPIDLKLIIRFVAVSVVSLVILVGMGELRKLSQKDVADEAFQGTLFDMTAHWFVGNQNHGDIVKVADIYRAVPKDMDYKYGSSFLNIIYAPIPRSMWPEKPAISMGYEIREKVYGRTTLRRGGPPPGFVVECLVNFGIPGVLVGGLIAGFLIRVYYNSFMPIVRTNDVALLIYSSTFMTTFFSFYTIDMTIIIANYMRSAVTILVTAIAFLWICGTERYQYSDSVN